MSLSDPISNMLTSLRNASQVRKESVDLPASKISEKILGIFKDAGYIEDYRLLKDDKQGVLKVYLKYLNNRQSAITGLKRISKPGLRIYAKSTELPKVLSGLGTAIVSTSKGVLSDREARQLKVGGEVLCHIW